MSTLPERDVVKGKPEMALSREDLSKLKKEADEENVNFWRERIKSASSLPQYEEFKQTKESARNFYKGKFFTKAEIDSWEGDTVQANLFRRTVNFMVDSVYSEDPRTSVGSRRKSTMLDPKINGILKDHLDYIFSEENLKVEFKNVLKDAFFGNISSVKIDFDKQRGIFRAKMVCGLLVIDPDARGDVSRARWIAEQVVMPRYRVWQESMFDAKAREEIKARRSQSSISYSSNDTTADTLLYRNENKDSEILWFIYTKEGISPLKYGVNADQDQQKMDGGSKSRLLVLCENYDGWLANIDNPTPFLDDDEFSFEVFRWDNLPGDWIGAAPWELVKSVVLAFNWAASYHMSDMRITSARTIAYDKNKIEDPNAAFRSRKHQVAVGTDGPPGDAVVPIDKGQADKTIFDSVNFFSGLLDKITGIDEIARGEEGRTKTATESQILQQNSNVILRGPNANLDHFLNSVVRKLALATLYYTPAFSVVPNPSFVPLSAEQQMMSPLATRQPQFLTRQVTQVPALDPMSGMPAVDPATGQPAMQQQIVMIPAEGATEPAKGMDYFHGDEAAIAWSTLAQIPHEELRCELRFNIEAGSTRAEKRLEKKQEATELLNTWGTELKTLGLHGEMWELWDQYLNAFQIDKTKILPPKEMYLQMSMMMQQVMQQNAMMGAEQDGAGGAGKGNSGAFAQDKAGSAMKGTDFPMSSSTKEQSSGS